MMVSGAGTKHYFHQNHLYSVAAMTSSTGAVVERYRYDAYGKRTVTNAAGTPIAASTIGQQRGFTGYYLDAETGLYFARARMYSAGLGKFTSRDPWMIHGISDGNVTVLGFYGTKTTFYWGPNAGDGYQDGYSLYGNYFTPNRTDPSGTTCWPWKCYFLACMQSMGVPIPSGWYGAAGLAIGTAGVINTAATAGVVTTTTTTALGTITVTSTPTVGALASGSTAVAGGTVLGGAATVAAGALTAAAAGVATGCAANATAHKTYDCFWWCADVRTDCSGFTGFGQTLP